MVRMKRIFPKKQFFNAFKVGLFSPLTILHNSLSTHPKRKKEIVTPSTFTLPGFFHTDNYSLHVNGFNSSLFNVAFYVGFHELLSLTRFTGSLLTPTHKLSPASM